VFCRRLAALTVFFCCLSLSCSRGGLVGVERLAILPIENLTSDTGLDWVGDAGAAVLAYDLTGPKNIHAIRVAAIRDARASRATRYLEAYFAIEGGALVFHVTIEDPEKVKAVRTFVARGAANDVAGVMNRMAKELNVDARAVSGCNTTALRLYGDALGGRGTMDAAAQADPNCVAVNLDWAGERIAKGDRDGAARACAATLALPKLDAIDRARAEFLNATAKGDQAARLDAIKRLGSLLPADSDTLRTAGALQLAGHQLQAAVRSWELATQADPGDPPAWNELGYARAYNHDLEGARKALEQYVKLLPPEDWNGLDSLGEVNFYFGDFAVAERYFLDAHKAGGAPMELQKAAQAHMMTGDMAGADAIFARLGNRDPLERAEWEFLTGRRKQALARLNSILKDPRVGLHMLIWKAQTGLGPAPQGGGDPLSQAVSRVLSGQFAEATPILEQIYGATPPGSDGLVRTLLAWSYARIGRAQEAAKLLELYPIPIAGNGNTALASLVFPRFAQLRAEVLHSQMDRQLAVKYAGDLPDSVR
jgi:Flp pilus assembly protein TadD